jgi:hypothetical protein
MNYYYDRKLARQNMAQFQREEPVQAAVARRLMQLAGYVADVGCTAAFRRKLRNLKMSFADFGEDEERPSRIRLFAFNRAVDALAQTLPLWCKQEYLDLLKAGELEPWTEVEWETDFPIMARAALDGFRGSN